VRRGGWGREFRSSAAILLVFALLALLAIRKVGDPDVGYHLRSGERLLAGEGWQRTDPFTYTLADHPDVNPSWGYDLVLAAIQEGPGAPGLVFFNTVLILLVFFTISRTARLESLDPAWLAGFLLPGVLASELRFEVRPEIVSWLLLAVVFHLLHRRALGRPSPIWVLPLIHLVWANCHSLFVLGWIAAGRFLAGHAIRWRRIDSRLFGWTLASVGACFVSPYGWRGVLLPFTQAAMLEEGNPFKRAIGEFVSPFLLRAPESFPFLPRLPILGFQILVGLAALALPLLFRRGRTDLLLPPLVFFVPAAAMIRNVPLFVIASFPGLVWAFSRTGIPGTSGFLARIAPGTRKGLLAGIGLVSVVLGLRVIHDSHYIAARRPCRFGWGWNELVLPLSAADFAVRAGLEGPVLNHLNFGGTLMWKLGRPVFIHARLEVVGGEFFREYRNILQSERELEAAVRRYGIRWVVFPYVTEPELLGRLSRDPRWEIAYRDHLAVIFVRRNSAERGVHVWGSAIRAGGAVEAPPLGSLPGLGGDPRPARLAHWPACFERRDSLRRSSTWVCSTSSGGSRISRDGASRGRSPRAGAPTTSCTPILLHRCTGRDASARRGSATGSSSRRTPRIGLRGGGSR
jgi:hypothetical protein